MPPCAFVIHSDDDIPLGWRAHHDAINESDDETWLLRSTRACPAANLCAEEPMTPDLQVALADLDRAFDPSFAWWVRVYDPKSGGCYYGLSGKAARAAGDKKFGPDIEATSKLVSVVEWSGVADELQQPFKESIIRFMQSRQDPDSGFFRDPEFANNYSDNTLNRAVSMASGALRRCGSEPLYPLPIDRVAVNAEAAEHYAYLASPQALTAWLDALPWERRIWTVGGRILAQSGLYAGIEEPRRSELLQTFASYVAARQADDGYFGEAQSNGAGDGEE